MIMDHRVKGIEEDHVISAVSRCVEDAFEVALEIAVNEISRLMVQAMQDVRKQIHETQQENITLKLRLQQIHAEQDNPKQLAADPNLYRVDSDNLGADTSVNLCEKESEEPDEYASCEKLRQSFHDKDDDGYLRSNETHESDNNENDTPDLKMEFKTDHMQHMEPSDQDPSLFQPTFEQIQVKNEKPEPEEPVLDVSSGCDSDVEPDCCFDQRSNEELGLDRIAMAQSKLLEDWRPDLQQQHSETAPLDQRPSLDISLGTSEISLSSTGCAPAFSNPFDGIHQSADETSPIQPPQNCRDHLRTNVQSRLYVCKSCDHAFHSESGLHSHQIQHHSSVLKTVSKGAHETRPKKQKQQLFPPGCSPYHCTVCNRDFNRLENLKTHLRIHTGERPYACSVCDVRFRHAGALTRHFRIHTGEKPYVCSECGKRFRNCGGLRFHQKSHSPSVHTVSK
nr:zinc finger protein 239-like isoform X1 [Misgurnus anguillicaudatus]